MLPADLAALSCRACERELSCDEALFIHRQVGARRVGPSELVAELERIVICFDRERCGNRERWDVLTDWPGMRP